ncbi:hypothetical protein NZD89_14430 [Alicyclobacillus fastidiosus]|uniref:Uncharacterized protein n=1 Tax=Alicyclobacillus fastidiosus TaxID=392011 RepID=A0ABY6Z9R1_9BACL|nr:hypothetical protein [Alicyclobacillus fastidiosus]WAH39615.1 hypothetical protein NZD89_14430 [Alicyclobacillus fastidiosus]GMA60822.1 hypothetical protein GCM10025859_12620 [Alicyclobacillus fastidiosus]
MPSGGKDKYKWIHIFDDWFIPMAFGVVAVLVGVQALARIPIVRSTIDAKEGRFVAQTAAVMQKAVQNDSAVVTLSANSTQAASHVEVTINGNSLGAFTTNEMRITVHDGDLISFRDTAGVKVEISVEDTSDSQLLLPAPGQVVDLDAQNKQASLSKAEFI